MTAFNDFTDEVRQSALRVGTLDHRTRRSHQLINSNPKNVPLVTSAVLKVVDEKSLEWCESHPEQVASLAMDHLGSFASVFFFILSLFIPGSFLFTLVSFLVPIILNILSRRRAAGTLDMVELNSGSTAFLTGLKDG